MGRDYSAELNEAAELPLPNKRAEIDLLRLKLDIQILETFKAQLSTEDRAEYDRHGIASPRIGKLLDAMIPAIIDSYGSFSLISDVVISRIHEAWSDGHMLRLQEILKSLEYSAQVRLGEHKGTITVGDYAEKQRLIPELKSLQKSGLATIKEVATKIESGEFPGLTRQRTALLSFAKERPTTFKSFLSGAQPQISAVQFFEEWLTWSISGSSPEATRQRLTKFSTRKRAAKAM